MPDIFNPGLKDLGFVKDVFDEVMAVFSHAYIHLGGDEAVKNHISSAPRYRCRSRGWVAPVLVATVRSSDTTVLSTTGWRIGVATEPGTEALLDNDDATAWVCPAPVPAHQASATIETGKKRKLGGFSTMAPRNNDRRSLATLLFCRGEHRRGSLGIFGKREMARYRHCVCD